MSRQHIRFVEGAISPDTALRLARFFGKSAEMWMMLQADHDLEVTRAARVTIRDTP